MIRMFLAACMASLSTAAMAAAPIVMHRDPGCPCCEKWAAQVRAQFGRRVQTLDDPARAALHKRLGVPQRLASCHTTIIDGLVFEGHVPLADVKRLLAERPKGVKGLAVAGMPLGSPGMEVPGGHRQPFDVVAFGTGGAKVYSRHRG